MFFTGFKSGRTVGRVQRWDDSFARCFNRARNNMHTTTMAVGKKEKQLARVSGTGRIRIPVVGTGAAMVTNGRAAFVAASRAVGVLRRRRITRSVITTNAMECEEAKMVLENEGYMFIDMRSKREYDEEHITKPARKTVNIPCCTGDEVDGFVGEIVKRYRDTAKLLLVCKSGELGVECAEILMKEYGYGSVYGVQGGYEGWMEKYTTSGRRRMPKGKFVSSGREALKSGLNLDPTVASTYEENWGRPELSIYTGSTRKSGQDDGEAE